MAPLPTWKPIRGMNIPAAIARLPFDLLRSQRITREPRMMGEAMERYLDREPLPEAYLPQRMAFTRWKTPPYQLAWGSNARSLIQALEQGYEQRRHLAQVGQGAAPALSPTEAVEQLHANRLPQPSDNMSPNMNAVPLARGAVPRNTITTAQDLDAIAQSYHAWIGKKGAHRVDKLNRARGEATAAQSRLPAPEFNAGSAQVADQAIDHGVREAQSIFDDQSQKPWFMREPDQGGFGG